MVRGRQAQRRKQRKENIVRVMLLSPSLLTIGGCLIAPRLIVLVYSFLTPGTFGGVIWEATFDAYIQFLF